MDKSLVLKFDPNTIEHLGISLYSQLPSVISELVSNSWDADANNISINFIDKNGEKEIIYRDDGHGMTFDELNQKYLRIGRNRRDDEKSQTTPNGRRVIGKKGLGKLSVFGICDEVQIKTIKKGVLNCFLMNLNDIKNSSSTEYKPIILSFNESSDETDGTEIWLKKIRRKSPFKTSDIGLGLSKKFVIFDDLKVILLDNSKISLEVTNEMKFNGFNIQYEWEFPEESLKNNYFYWDKVKGKIITLHTPIKETDMKGIYLTSRGKIVNNASFYDLRDTDQFHTYVTGYLEVDFIDDLPEDLISTDRQSLNWEHDITKELKEYLQYVIKQIGYQWLKKRKQAKADLIKADTGVDVEDWKKNLVPYERQLASDIVDPILEQAQIGTLESSEIIKSVMDKFDNNDFKAYASQIAAAVNPEEIPKLLKLLDEWKTVEVKQLSDLAQSRIEVINQFERYLNQETKEVPTLHDFFKKFSWLLDPRILEFKDEVRYTSLLRENYPDKDLDEKDRRIDFLCSNALGGILYVIEIKRSHYKIDKKAIEQAYEYGVFLKQNYASESGFSTVVCYVIGGVKSDEAVFLSKEKTYRQSGEVFIKTYTELLEQSKQFHKEFIEAYNKSK